MNLDPEKEYLKTINEEATAQWNMDVLSALMKDLKWYNGTPLKCNWTAESSNDRPESDSE